MKIILLCVGKTSQKELIQLISVYEKRLENVVNYEKIELTESAKNKTLPPQQLIEMEAEQILQKLKPADFVCLLDENGSLFTSKLFADFLQKKMLASFKRLVFVVGGAYGFSEKIYARANEKISLSKMTFTHQMVRLFFTEQLYRSFSIIHNKPYHHE